MRFTGGHVRLHELSTTAARPWAGGAGCRFLGPCLALGLPLRLWSPEATFWALVDRLTSGKGS